MPQSRAEALLAFVGRRIEELPTPALLIDLPTFEQNLVCMADFFRARRVGFRPHGKTHKCPIIARRQLASGALGICAAKLGEAEVFAAGGLADILITTEVVGKPKIDRLVALVETTPTVKVVVDNAQNVADLGQAARARGVRLKVLIDVNVGQNRTGVDRPVDVVALSQAIAREPALEFIGLQAYAGHNMHIIGYENRRAASLRALDRAAAAREVLERGGFRVQIFSVGGTGTYSIDVDFPGVTEIQPGSYIFMDAHYRRIGGQGTELYTDFGNALTVLTTVISRVSGRAVTDGGNKVLPTDEDLPEPKDLRGATYRPGGDEHGILSLTAPSRDLTVGAKVEFIPGHCDTTVNLFDVFFGVRDGVVDCVLPIEARGRSD